MQIRLYLIGKVREGYLLAGEADYLQRLKRYAKLNLFEVKSPEQLLSQLSPRDRLVLLDQSGEQVDSEKFSKLIEQHMLSSAQELVFAIGPAEGWNEAAKAKCKTLLSLSLMTFPHQMVRLILLEQLYRAFTIIRGEPYHKK